MTEQSKTPLTDALHQKLVKASENALTWIAGRDYVEMREHANTLETKNDCLQHQVERWLSERDEAVNRAFHCEQSWTKERADRAETLLALAQDEIKTLRELLNEAADDITNWGAYAGEYFKKKHDLAGTVKRYKDAASGADRKD